MIRLTKVSKSFGSGHSLTRVLSGINVDIAPGTFNVFFGRSGSGKSTLLNLIAGLDRPDTGDVDVCGHRLAPYNAEQLARFRLHHIGLVFQFFNLLPTLSLADNIALAGHLKKLPKMEINLRLHDLLKKVGLSQQAHRMPHEASGGEIQRAAVARALINEPDILLADEPTGNLDLENQQAVADILLNLVKRDRKTVLLVTHDPFFEAFGDHVYRIDNGGVVKS